jgi:hypothetical protein
MAAAQTIFLWLRRQRPHVRLTRQTSGRLQHEATLARLQHEQECCARTALTEAQQQQKSAACMKALADEADKRRRQALAWLMSSYARGRTNVLHRPLRRSWPLNE